MRRRSLIVCLAFTQLMEHQTDYFDRAVADQTPTQIRENLIKLAEKAGVESSKLVAIKDKLTYKTSPNGGVDVTNDVKWFSTSSQSLPLLRRSLH